MREFNYYEPKAISEACGLLRAEGAKVIAGGTDLIVQIKRGVLKPASVINIKSVEELNGITASDEGLTIGALTKISKIAASADILGHNRAICVGADNIGTPQVRSLATIGGNICNSSPCADTVPGLLVADAVAIIADGTGERRMPLADFFRGPGKNALDKEKGELLKAIFLPKLPENTTQGFYKAGPRKAADIAVINMAISLSFKNGICTRARIAMGSVAPVPKRAYDAENAIESRGTIRDFDEIAELIARAASPIDDVRGSAKYRLHMLRVAAAELLEELCNRGEGKND
ncbi:FAD binding domain-containing protein [Synergistes jonesii]|uniref:FAD binding domain-containing protein n=1 Tax=Synergistes jonesii TaxID=2754 RepID=UPI0033339CD7